MRACGRPGAGLTEQGAGVVLLAMEAQGHPDPRLWIAGLGSSTSVLPNRWGSIKIPVVDI